VGRTRTQEFAVSPDQEKRKLREMKRAVKRRGNKHRRHAAKRVLAEHPDEAADANDDFGRHSSERLNGPTRDATRHIPD
jgi:hypothetical protein